MLLQACNEISVPNRTSIIMLFGWQLYTHDRHHLVISFDIELLERFRFEAKLFVELVAVN